MSNNNLINNIIKKNTKVKFQLKNEELEVSRINFKLPKLEYSLFKDNKETVDKIKAVNKAYFRKHYSVDTYKTVKCKKCEIPRGFYVFKSIYSPSFKLSVFKELENTYQKNIHDSSFSEQFNRTKVFLFDNMNIQQVIAYSKIINPLLSSMIEKISIDILSNLQIKASNIKKVMKLSKLVIVRYAKHSGIYTHIDNIGRSDGLVLTISFGPHITYYDLIPLDNTKDSLRIKLNEAEPIIMDGASRYIYAHSIPNGLDYYPSNTRYCFVFLITKYNKINCFADKKYFNIEMCEQNDYKKYK